MIFFGIKCLGKRSFAEDSGGETTGAECKSSDSQRRKTLKAKTTNGIKSKLASQTKTLNKQQMEELSLWIFPDKEAKNVESELRERLLKSPRVKVFEERWKIALRFKSEELQENFNILNVAFCRKFATLAKQCYENNLPKDSLKNLEGNLTFPRVELVPFLRSVDKSERAG